MQLHFVHEYLHSFLLFSYQYPAIYDEVIEVGAIDNNNNIADFSNTNPQVDIVAPGVNIYSTFINNVTATFSGTSMAAPHVSGAIALIINKYEKKYMKSLTRSEILKLLFKHTKNITFNNTSFVFKSIDFSL